jgi:elongator complex protein 4
LDGLLGEHLGLAHGTSLVGKSGTTDFGGSLLRYYASKGVVQGHHVNVLGKLDREVRPPPPKRDYLTLKLMIIC